jgi:hypothetical protein
MKVIEAENRDFLPLWMRLWQNDAFQHPFGTPLNAEYSKIYASGAEFIDRSFIVEEQGEPVLGVQIALLQRTGKLVGISAFGRPVLYLESTHCTADVIKRAKKPLKEQLTAIMNEAPGAAILYCDFLAKGELTYLGQCLLDDGASAQPYFTQIINILSSEEELKRDVRKSYKSLINWGTKNLAVRILDQQTITCADMEQFRQLHIQEAGRETRSARTWEIQYEQVRNGEAFVVLGELSGELVTAALFLHSDRYCYYGVSASVRALFDKPLSHCIIWTAILQAKRIGCSVLELGEQLFQAQGRPSAKELGISVFKRGFGGETALRLTIVREFNDFASGMIGNETATSASHND